MTHGLGRRGFLAGASATLALGAAGCAAGGGAGTAPIGRAARTLRARGLAQVVSGRPSVDGAGVSLTRHLGQAALPSLDPFVLLDELHSDDPAAYLAGFPNHPHRGFETVTLMLDGRMRHRDSRGNAGLITGGGAQWMTAGSGIVHSEMPEQERGELWGFQLWVNLPRAEKWRAPEYQDLGPERLAEVSLDRGGTLRVVAGEALGARGPIAPRTTEPLLATLTLREGDDVELRVPRAHAVMVLCAEGAAEVGPRRERLAEGHLGVLEDAGELVRLRGPSGGATLVVVAGAPLREPMVHRGPFVMSTEREIEEAFADYRAGRLG